MNKAEYMNELRQELNGLPANVVEDTMWAYEGRFVDGMAAGRNELDIAASLPAPHIVAAQKRASLRYQELKENATPTNFASVLIALIGLMMFNFFMIIPAIFGSVFLFTGYLSSMALYFIGIVITATVLAGVPEINLNIPTRHYHHIYENVADDVSDGIKVDSNEDMKKEFSVHHGNVRVDITSKGITIDNDELSDAHVKSTPSTSTPAPSNMKVEKQIENKEPVDKSVVHLSIGHHLKTIDIFQGLAFLFGGVALFMLCLFTTKYTFVGFKKYLLWNVSLLRQSAA